MTDTKAPYLPASLANIHPSDLDRGFFEATRRHELTVQRCDRCGNYQHPPKEACSSCRSFELSWEPVAPTGTIYTYTVVHHPVGAVADYVPYVVIVVELDDAPVRLVSNLVEVDHTAVEIGMPVEVVWDDISDEVTLPRFRPVGSPPAS